MSFGLNESGEPIVVKIELDEEEEDGRCNTMFEQVLPHIFSYLSPAEERRLRLVNRTWREGVDYFRVFRLHNKNWISSTEVPSTSRDNKQECSCQSQLTKLESELAVVKEKLTTVKIQIAQILFLSTALGTHLKAEGVSGGSAKAEETSQTAVASKMEEARKFAKNKSSTHAPTRESEPSKLEDDYNPMLDFDAVMETPVDPTSFQCSHCSKCFNKKVALVRHQKLHKESNEFKCRKCGKSFRSQSGLTTHENVHNTRFRCKICKKRCSCQAILDEHIRSHSEEKNFECSHCDKKFTRKSGLDSHMKAVHGKQTRYSCGQCGRHFIWSNSLRRHVCGTRKDKPQQRKKKGAS